MSNKVSTRLALAWKAFSVQALVLIGSQELWYPFIQSLAISYFGDNAQVYITMFLSIAGILGWITPQQKLNAKINGAPI